jgi:hypothetical protein
MATIVISVAGLEGDIQGSIRAQFTAAVAPTMPDRLRELRDTWGQVLSSKQLPEKDRIVEALRREDAIEYPIDDDPLRGQVVARVPAGGGGGKERGPRDMKPGLLIGPKSRPTSYGGRYNIIPLPENGGVKFRTVSSRSPANSWIHPGFGARDIAGTGYAAAHEDIAADVLRKYGAEGTR